MAKELRGLKIEAKPERVTSLAKFSVRPQRFAFIIDKEAGAGRLLEIVKYNSRIWGGFYNLNLPCVAGELSEVSIQMLYDFDPDRLVYCGDVPENLRRELTDWIQPFGVVDLDHHIQNIKDSHDFCRPIQMYSVFADVERDLRSEDESNIRVPVISDAHPLYQHACAQLGLLDESNAKFLVDALKATTLEFPDEQGLPEYLDSLKDMFDKIYPWRLTTHGLRPLSRMDFSHDVVIVLGDRADVEAFCLFWNLRLGIIGPRSKGDRAYLFLPLASVQEDSDLEALAAWVSPLVEPNGQVVLATSSDNVSSMQPAFQKLQKLLPRSTLRIRKLEQQGLPFTKVTEVEPRREIAWTGTYSRFEVPQPSFDLKWVHESEIWVVDCDFEDRSTRRQSYYPPRTPGQKDLLMKETLQQREYGSIFGDFWRLSQDRVACQATKKDSYQEIRLPGPDQIFERVAAQCGFQFTLTEKCGYIRAFTRVFDDAGMHHMLKDTRIRRCLEKLSIEGKSLTLDQLKGEGKFGRDGAPLEEIILSLLKNDGLFQGVRYRCPHCNLLRWYQFSTVQSRMRCAGCKGEFQTPLEVEKSYSLNSLVALAIDQGAIPVALTEPVLRRLCSKTYYSTPGALLTDFKGEKCDVDIVASCDGQLVCVECKTLKDLEAKDSAGEIPEQLARDYDHAKQLGASIFAVSVLSNDPPNEIRDVIRRANDLPCSPVAILITLRDMERGFLSESVVGSPAPASRGEAPISVEALIYRVKQNGFNV